MERNLIQELAKKSTDEDSVIDWRWGAEGWVVKDGCWLCLDVGRIMGLVTCGRRRFGEKTTETQFCSDLNARV